MEKKLYKSTKDKKLCGVCGGIAEYFNIDSTIIRLICLFLILCAGTGLLAYIIVAIILPTDVSINAVVVENKKTKKLYRSTKDKKICGVCGGVAEYFNIDVSLVRIIWVLSVILCGTGIFMYIISAIIIPEKENK